MTQPQSAVPETIPSPSRPQPSLLPPSQKKRPTKSKKVFRLFRTALRAFPIIAPSCKLPTTSRLHDGHIHGGSSMTGTLFGRRRARISLAIQESSQCLPALLLELSISTAKLLQEMGPGHVRIALECEKRPGDKTRLIDEPVWTMYCNGRKTGYAVKRSPTDEDLKVMELLHAVSMGAGVLPSETEDSPDGELTYMRAHLERAVGSRDSETYYMFNPDGHSGPELSIFFVRI